jgi:L-threonylcarbamoyladenylate synthase
VESTIIDLTADRPRILRPGAVTREQVEVLLKTAVGSSTASAPRVSGSLPSHYAPQARVEIVAEEMLSARADELTRQGQLVALLVNQPDSISGNGRPIQLPLSSDPVRLAHNLYNVLRQVDKIGCDVALVSLPADEGLGAAIADRLRRAAGPRSA